MSYDPKLLELAAQVIDGARAKNKKLATAESCTGGLISAVLTEIAGASDVLEFGFVTYANRAKTELLGVSTHLIARHGAVSEEVARAMAAGALKRAGAQLSVAVTGIAGPGGGTKEKPVGLVHIAAARPDKVLHERHEFGDLGREQVRRKSAEAALQLLLQLI